MGQAIIDLCNGKIPAIIPGGFDFVDVRDVSEGIIKSLQRGRIGESYLFSGSWHSIREIARMLSDITGEELIH
jgi:dihydroflavonol-4-reductase